MSFFQVDVPMQTTVHRMVEITGANSSMVAVHGNNVVYLYDPNVKGSLKAYATDAKEYAADVREYDEGFDTHATRIPQRDINERFEVHIS